MMSGQERKAAERQARRRRIQRVARKLFADRGFQRTTIEDVARRAGLSVGAIYLYTSNNSGAWTFTLTDLRLEKLSTIFLDGFESNNTNAWSATVP